MPPSFFLYARKSTDSEEKQVLSIEAQLFELRSFAAKEKLEIKREFIESMTAKVPGRPIFNEMMSRMEKGEAQGIVAWHPDRLARNSVDGGRVIYLVDTGKITHLKFPTFWFESTPQGKFMMNIAFGQSKYYVDNLSENVRRGQRQKLRRGEWPFNPPLGYNGGGRYSFPKIDPVQGPLVRKLFETYATGHYILKDLSKLAAECGLSSRNGKKLAIGTVYRIITTSFYYGLMKVNGEVHLGVHEPLISKDLFDRVQEALTRKNRPNKYKKNNFPLLGLAVCSSCGCSITAERQKGYHYYRCTKKKEPCSEPYVREEKLSEQLREIVGKVALSETHYQQFMDLLAKEQTEVTQPVTQFKAVQGKKIAEVKSKLDRLLDAHLNGLVTQAEYVAKKEVMVNEKISLEQELAQFEQRTTNWLELARGFLLAAHQAHRETTEGNLESLKEKAKKVGSNFRMASKTLQFDYRLRWRLVERRAAAADFENLCARQDSNL